MASYLEGYGDAQAKRSRTLRWLILTPLVLLLLGTFLYFQFRDFRERRLASQFVELVKTKDFKAAYALWGCTEQKPCSEYPFNRFLEDWGPGGMLKNPSDARIAQSKGCKTGVISTLRASGQEDIQLWVDRQTEAIGFAPWRLKPVPSGFRMQFAAWMWDITRNCDPLIGP